MQYRFLGPSGLQVSELSFGSWVSFKNQVDVELAYEIMKIAFQKGINFFDNAEVYAQGEAEVVMGEVVKKGIADKVWTRDDLVLSTKIFFGSENKTGPNATGLNRKHVVEGTLASLKRFQLDYVDLIFCHRPDPWTPIEETVRAFNHIIDRGLAFYWATSEWDAQEITEACEIADRLGMMRPIADQCQYNLLHRQYLDQDYKPLYKKYNYGTTIWSPLASGVLTGKYSGRKTPEGSRMSMESYKWLMDQYSDEQLDAVDKMKPLAEKVGCTLAQLSIAWVLKNPRVSTCILGATSVKQLEENLKAMDYVDKMTPEIMKELDEIFKSKPEPNDNLKFIQMIRKLPLP